jgi:hypothetical protein
MKSKVILIGAIFTLVLPASLWATDIRGNWIAEMPSTQGTTETVFSFKMDGTKVTGTVSDPQGESAISEGKIDGDWISFVVARGSGKDETKLVYRGAVSLNEIKFTLKVEGGTGQPQKFTARREFPRNGDVPLIKEMSRKLRN